VFLSFVAWITVCVYHFGEGLGFTVISLATIVSMASFVNLLNLWHAKNSSLVKTVIYSGVVVGVFSIIELTVLYSLFESYWGAAGGVRSSSTMFNPNNLGLYIGACILLISFNFSIVKYPMLCFVFLLFPLVASGSRTAWVSLVFTIFAQLFSSKRFRRGLFHQSPVRLIVNLGICWCIGVVFLSFYFNSVSNIGIESVHRGTDLYTANLRVKNYYDFMDSLDGSIFVPDYLSKRVPLVTDSFYLAVVNSTGILGSLLGFVLICTAFSVRVSACGALEPWLWVSVYYLFSGLGGSHLNAFPNNQLFFVSIGSLFVYIVEGKLNRKSNFIT